MATSGVSAFNYIRTLSSEAFQDLVPNATLENISTISNILFNRNYAPMLNEFVGNLVNRIILTRVELKSFNNPLAIFKKGSQPLGTDIQEIYENPAIAEQYSYSNEAMSKLLTITDPDTHVAYYRLNRKDLYTKTIAKTGLQGAFVSWDKFEEFINSVVNSLYSGNYIDEFKYMKALIDGAYDQNKVIVETVTDVTDQASAKAFIKTVRKIFNYFKFPSSEYNAYSKFTAGEKSVTTWTTEDRIALIIRADILAETDVEVIASAFNIDSAKLVGRVVPIDRFENDAILGILCDEAFLQVYDNVFQFEEFYNARTMTYNEYLHVWGTFAISPFANAVVFATEQPEPVTAISVPDASLVGEGATSTLTVTLTPSDTTSEIDYASSDTEVFTLEKLSNTSIKVTSTGVGTAKIIALSDNAIQSESTVTVTAS